MTLEELKQQCLKAKSNGLARIMLVVPRKGPPTAEHIRVKGLGKGYVMNAGEHDDGTWAILAQFEADHILRTIEKQEQLDALRIKESEK